MAPDLRRRPADSGQQLDKTAIEQLDGDVIENADGFEHVARASSLANPVDHSLIFVERFSDEACARIEEAAGRSILFALHPDFRAHVRRPAIFSEHVRLIYTRIVEALFDYHRGYWDALEDAGTAQARLPGTRIMQGAHIHRTATVGEGSLIFPGCVVGPNVIIGKRALIKPNTVIGLPGFGVFRNPHGDNTHLPHVGGVVIGDDVEFGALTTVCAGTFHPTLVGDGVKTDDHVHIAHNCDIGSGTQIAAHAELSGSVTVGRNVWLSPNVSVVNGLTIGDRAFVGIAANVTKDIAADTLVAGNPAKVLRTLTPAD